MKSVPGRTYQKKKQSLLQQQQADVFFHSPRGVLVPIEDRFRSHYVHDDDLCDFGGDFLVDEYMYESTK